MPKNATQKAAVLQMNHASAKGEKIMSEDIIVKYARQLTESIQLNDVVVLEQCAGDPESPVAKNADVISKDAGEALSALETLIGSTKATSLEGALVQLMMIGVETRCCADSEEAEDRQDYCRIINRLTYSIMDVLSQHININFDVLQDWYMAERGNPWLRSKEALAVITAANTNA